MGNANSAINRGVATSAKMLVEEYAGGMVLDYGAGTGRNLRYMLNEGVAAEGIETEEQLFRSGDKLEGLPVSTRDTLGDKKYQLILCSFVLNVIPEDTEKLFVLQDISDHLAEGGKVFLELMRRTDTLKAKTKKPYGDGWMSRRGYQEYVHPDKLLFLVDKAGLQIDSYCENGVKYIVTLTRKETTI